MTLEGEALHFLIDTYSYKIGTKLEKIEPKLFELNEFRDRLTPADLENFENSRKSYVSQKQAYDKLMESDGLYPSLQSAKDNWAYLDSIASSIDNLKELKSLFE